MYLLLADDLTGGNDAGIQFVKNGLEARLALSPEFAPLLVTTGAERPVCIVNTNSRNLSAGDAGNCIASVAASLRQKAFPEPSMVFKKIDSTLRGNPGAEMDAIMDGFGLSAAFFAPSYPKQGRTVRNGTLLVNGTPVHETAFANDPLTPVRESSVEAIMRKQTSRAVAAVSLGEIEAGTDALATHVRELIAGGARCIIFDAETAEHLTALAALGLAMESRPLFVGSAGLAEALAPLLPRSREKTGAGGAAEPGGADHVLFLCGSAHQTTHDQVEELAAAGVPVIRMPETILADPDAPARSSRALVAALRKGPAVLTAPLDRISTTGSMAAGLAIGTALSAIALAALDDLRDTPEATALIMTGGETAYAVLQRLASCLTLYAEPAPGIALSTVSGGPWNGLTVVTKAGGFGGPHTMVDILDMLRHKKPQRKSA